MKKDFFKSSFIFPNTSFLIGMGSVLNIAGNYFEFPIPETGENTDTRTISSSIAPWQDLEKYITLVPDSADRIIGIVEKQHEHKMMLEKSIAKEQLYQSKLGQIFGLIIGLSAIAGGVACIINNHEISGAFIGGGGITGLVSVFVIGKKKMSRNSS